MKGTFQYLSLLTSFKKFCILLHHFGLFRRPTCSFGFQSCTSLVQLVLYNSIWNQPRSFLNIDVKFQVSKAQDLNAIHHLTFASSTSHYLTKSLHKAFRHGGFGTLKSRLKGWRGIKDGCENCFHPRRSWKETHSKKLPTSAEPPGPCQETSIVAFQ